MIEALPNQGYPSDVVLPDGRVELADGLTLDDPRLVSDDLLPIAIGKRTWSTYTYAALWISMAHCIPTYMMASGLIENGMNWWQALATILLGNTIVLAPILLNSHPGTKYGIPFPVFARAAYGTTGANVPAVMRAIVACGWFGINAWIGGQALQAFFTSLYRGWPSVLGDDLLGGYLPTEWVSFGLFWALNILVVYRGMDLLRKVENAAAPFVLVMTVILLVWVLIRAHGVGDLLARPSTFTSLGQFWKKFVPSVTGMIGFWATLSLNMPDFTRYGRSQKEQAVGQIVALPTTMTVFAGMGILITSASSKIWGTTIWEPVKLVSHFESRLVIAIATFTIVVATISVNIAANVVSPANDFANLAPKHISFKTGGLLTGILGALMMPWKLLADADTYIGKWLVGYSGGLAAIAGVLIADYWIIRKKELRLADLYRSNGVYRYASGWNPAAIIATIAGCTVAWIGLAVPFLRVLFDYAWFVSVGTSAGVYVLLMRTARKD